MCIGVSLDYLTPVNAHWGTDSVRQRLSYYALRHLMSTTLCGSRVNVCSFPPSVWWWTLLTSLTLKRKVPSVLFQWDTVCVCTVHACRFNLPCLGLSGAHFYRSSPPKRPLWPPGAMGYDWPWTFSLINTDPQLMFFLIPFCIVSSLKDMVGM